MRRKMSVAGFCLCSLFLLAACDDLPTFPNLDGLGEKVAKDLEAFIKRATDEFLQRAEQRGYRIAPEHRRQMVLVASESPFRDDRYAFMLQTRIMGPCLVSELLKTLNLDPDAEEYGPVFALMTVAPDKPLCAEDRKELAGIMAADEELFRNAAPSMSPTALETARRVLDAKRERVRLNLLATRSLEEGALALNTLLNSKGIGQKQRDSASQILKRRLKELLEIYVATIEG